MYAEILNGKITHYRGDTLTTPIRIFEGDKLCPIQYTLDENDVLYLYIMEPGQAFEDAIIKKVFTSNSEKDVEGNIILHLKTTDTEFLTPGTYYYTLKLKQVIDNRLVMKTIIQPTLFWLLGNIPEQGSDEPEIDDDVIILDGGEITMPNEGEWFIYVKNKWWLRF